MLCGDKGSWIPVRQCKNNLPKDKIGHEVNLQIYSDEYHGFDAPGLDLVIA
jgi:hypothetical protein